MAIRHRTPADSSFSPQGKAAWDADHEGDASDLSFVQSGSGAVSRTAQAKMRDIVSVFDFMTTAQIADAQSGALTLDCTTAIQNAINGAHAVYVPPGLYKITSTITITNRNGFVLFGSGMVQTQFVWGGAAGGTMVQMRGSWFSKITDLYLNCNVSADTSLKLPTYVSGTDTHVATFNAFERLRLGNTRTGSTIAVVIGDAIGSQLDNQTFFKCWFENAGKLATITGGVTLNINFHECVFSGYSVIPTTVGVDIISGGLVNFVGCQFVGSGPSTAYIQRSTVALAVSCIACEMESTGPFLHAPDDSGFANTWPITLTACVIGFTGTASTNIIDYRQRGALIITGGDINSTNAANLNHNPPDAGILQDDGVRYVNVTVVQGSSSVRSGVRRTGEFISSLSSGNVLGGKTAIGGVNLTLGSGSADDTLVRHLGQKQGGGTCNATWCGQTTTGITTAKTIAGLEDGSFVIVRGSDGAGNDFMDLVITQNSGTPTTITSKTLSGSPTARTYSISSFNLQLAMASGTYTANTYWLQMPAR